MRYDTICIMYVYVYVYTIRYVPSVLRGRLVLGLGENRLDGVGGDEVFGGDQTHDRFLRATRNRGVHLRLGVRGGLGRGQTGLLLPRAQEGRGVRGHEPVRLAHGRRGALGLAHRHRLWVHNRVVLRAKINISSE